jgi:hypothetical protein
MSLLHGQKYACLLGYIKNFCDNSDLRLILLPIALTDFYSRDHQNDGKITIIIFRIKGIDEPMRDDLESPERYYSSEYYRISIYMLIMGVEHFSFFLQSSYELFVLFCLLIVPYIVYALLIWSCLSLDHQIDMRKR